MAGFGTVLKSVNAELDQSAQGAAKLAAAFIGLRTMVAETTREARTSLAETAATAAKAATEAKSAADEWQQQQLAMLERLRQMVIPFEGPDAGSQFSFDKIIEDQIAKVRAGQTTAAAAIQELQRQFGSVYGTLQNTFFASQDPQTREFLDELQRFINSGRLL